MDEGAVKPVLQCCDRQEKNGDNRAGERANQGREIIVISKNNIYVTFFSLSSAVNVLDSIQLGFCTLSSPAVKLS